MNNRITMKQLEMAVRNLNRVTGNPEAPYTKNEDGKYIANPGNYHLDCAYGGCQLDQMCNDGGGVRTISNTGYTTKRHLYNWTVAYTYGICAGKNK